MSEITKLYENCNIKPKQEGYCDWDSDCPYPRLKCNDECPYWKDENEAKYPPFTAEKQLLLLQWIVNKTDLYLHRHKTDFTYSIASGDIAVNKYKDFKESIAEFINTMWQSLTPEEQQQVKGILE